MFKPFQSDPQFGQFVVEQKSNSSLNRSPNTGYLSQNGKNCKFLNLQNNQFDCSKSFELSQQDKQSKGYNLEKTKETSKPSETKSFICHCQGIINDCFMCHGDKTIQQNDELVKFFDFILNFKLRKVQSYQTNTKSLIWGNHSTPLNLLSQINKSGLRKSQNSNIRLSVGSNPNILTNVSMNDKCQKQKFIHQGFNCDQCGQDPIIGTRFHCIEGCDDFDLCQRCYLQKGHQHQMKQYKLSGKYCQIKCVMNSLSKSSRIKKQRSYDLNQNFNQQEEIRKPSKTFYSSFH